MVHTAFQLAKRGFGPGARPQGDARWPRISQRRRKQVLFAASMLGFLLLAVTDSAWRAAAPQVHVSLRLCGLGLILLCILGRTWCTLYIGGCKKRELITSGPYSTVRNPLYLFTIIGTVGIGLLAGSLAAALLFGSVALAVFAHTARREEAFLEDAFGEAFRSYAAKVPRFWPRLSAWRDADEVTIKPRVVVRTFADTSLFLAALPLIALKDLLQHEGTLAILLLSP